MRANPSITSLILMIVGAIGFVIPFVYALTVAALVAFHPTGAMIFLNFTILYAILGMIGPAMVCQILTLYLLIYMALHAGLSRFSKIWRRGLALALTVASAWALPLALNLPIHAKIYAIKASQTDNLTTLPRFRALGVSASAHSTPPALTDCPSLCARALLSGAVESFLIFPSPESDTDTALSGLRVHLAKQDQCDGPALASLSLYRAERAALDRSVEDGLCLVAEPARFSDADIVLVEPDRKRSPTSKTGLFGGSLRDVATRQVWHIAGQDITEIYRDTNFHATVISAPLIVLYLPSIEPVDLRRGSISFGKIEVDQRRFGSRHTVWTRQFIERSLRLDLSLPSVNQAN